MTKSAWGRYTLEFNKEAARLALAENLRSVTREGSLLTVVGQTLLKRAEEEACAFANTLRRREATSIARLRPRTIF